MGARTRQGTAKPDYSLEALAAARRLAALVPPPILKLNLFSRPAPLDGRQRELNTGSDTYFVISSTFDPIQLLPSLFFHLPLLPAHNRPAEAPHRECNRTAAHMVPGQGAEAALGATRDRNKPRNLPPQRPSRETSASGRPRADRDGAGRRGAGRAKMAAACHADRRASFPDDGLKPLNARGTCAGSRAT